MHNRRGVQGDPRRDLQRAYNDAYEGSSKEELESALERYAQSRGRAEVSSLSIGWLRYNMGSFATCPTCKKKDVSRAAKVCPHCAQPLSFSPNWDSPRNILIFFVILFGIAVLVSNGGSKNGTNGIREDPDEPGHDPSSATCRSDWRKCRDNSDMAKHFSGWSHVREACQLAANDLAQYGTPEWPWTPFSSFMMVPPTVPA